jgi:hypothetical protein
MLKRERSVRNGRILKPCERLRVLRLAASAKRLK